MLLYGKYMLYFDKIFDFEEKLSRLNGMTHDLAQETIASMFDETKKAMALVGNTDQPLDF